MTPPPPPFRSFLNSTSKYCSLRLFFTHRWFRKSVRITKHNRQKVSWRHCHVDNCLAAAGGWADPCQRGKNQPMKWQENAHVIRLDQSEQPTWTMWDTSRTRLNCFSTYWCRSVSKAFCFVGLHHGQVSVVPVHKLLYSRCTGAPARCQRKGTNFWRKTFGWRTFQRGKS